MLLYGLFFFVPMPLNSYFLSPDDKVIGGAFFVPLQYRTPECLNFISIFDYDFCGISDSRFLYLKKSLP